MKVIRKGKDLLVAKLPATSFDYRIEKLVAEYFKANFNRHEAYRNAGWHGDPNNYADRLFKHPKVVALIQKRQKALRKKMHIDEEFVVQRIAKMADAPSILAQYTKVDAEGLPYYDFTGASKEDLAIISSIARDKKGNIKLTTHDVLGALSQLVKILGMAKEKVEVTGKDGEALVQVDEKELARKLAFLLARGAVEE